LSVKYTSHKSKVLSAVKAAKARALEICGGTAERYAKENLTINRSVDTGNLRNSITHAQRDENTEVVGTNVKYAPYVELGHHTVSGSFVAPKPYLRPAVENHREEYARIIKSELSRV